MTPSPIPARPAAPAAFVGIPCCTRAIDRHGYHIVGDKYLSAVAGAAGCVPVLLPALGAFYDWRDVLGRLDAVLLTGSPSNVEPHHYDGPAFAEGTKRDPARDDTTLPLITAVLELGVPILGICRGFQEINVALGGSLHQRVSEVTGRFDHNPGDGAEPEVTFGPAHPVRLSGQLAALLGAERITVNSVHNQGLDRVAEGLAVEAVADDGQPEAVRITGAKAFAVAVQWHPEWQHWRDPHSARLLGAFGDAARARLLARTPRDIATE